MPPPHHTTLYNIEKSHSQESFNSSMGLFYIIIHVTIIIENSNYCQEVTICILLLLAIFNKKTRSSHDSPVSLYLFLFLQYQFRNFDFLTSFHINSTTLNTLNITRTGDNHLRIEVLAVWSPYAEVTTICRKTQ